MHPLHLFVDLLPSNPSVEMFLKRWCCGYRDENRNKSLYEPNIEELWGRAGRALASLRVEEWDPALSR